MSIKRAFVLPNADLPPSDDRENGLHAGVRRTWATLFPDAKTNDGVDREIWFETADKLFALRRAGVEFDLLDSMPEPDPELEVHGVYGPPRVDGAKIVRSRGLGDYQGYAWPDGRSAAAAEKWWNDDVVRAHVGREMEIGDIPDEDHGADQPGSITKKMSLMAEDRDRDVMAKIVAVGKYQGLERIVVPRGASPGKCQELLWEAFGYAMEHLGGRKDGIMISDWIAMRKEYRIAMIDGRPAAGAGCIESFDPCFAIDHDEAFDVQVEEERGDGNVRTAYEDVQRYRESATQIGQGLREAGAGMRNFILDLAMKPDGEIVVVECNAMLNFGQYAMGYQHVFEAIRTLRRERGR